MRAKFEQVAEGVWVVRGGIGRTMSAFLIRDEGGVTVFDSGVRSMSDSIAAAADEMGGIERVVLGHAHPDHRGGAAGLHGAPVFTHAAEASHAQSADPAPYFEPARLPLHARTVMPRLLEVWDGGPVPVAGTLEEGDVVAGFEVVHLPGHAPGQIALWRSSDRLALTSDAFYTIDPVTGLRRPPRLPHQAFNQDEDELRRSLLKLAELGPAIAWPSHAEPVTGDVRSTLARLAET